SIDGHVEHWFADDTAARFEAYGWHVIRAIDGHDAAALDQAVRDARAHQGAPSLLCCRTVIGKGSPTKAGTHDVHGAPLGPDEIAAMRAELDWPYAPFDIPDKLYAAWNAHARGIAHEAAWKQRLAAYTEAFPAEARELQRRLDGKLPASWRARAVAALTTTQQDGHTIATRKASQNAIESLAPVLPELLGGSADLTGSNLTNWSGSKPVRADAAGNYLHYGVREFGMSAIMNGIALHGGFIPYGGTFLTFSDYSRNALRMAALMKIRSIFVFTHDSIGLGEDGPTHQPIEHVSSLRLIPNMAVWRPCDAVETMVAWIAAIERSDGPSCLVLSRQNLAHAARSAEQVVAIRKGGYILAEAEGGVPHAVLLATGSEVEIALKARIKLARAGIAVRVVSMPSTRDFDAQDSAYRNSVLPPDVPRVAIEAGVTDLWHKYVGLDGIVLGIDCFGESGPASQLHAHFGLTVEAVYDAVKAAIDQTANRYSLY
ncbi:MAG TPA: transketolase, partial [Burkholderiaceae bacterium]|nr:transketolase [Burkholderiaceae bacterium]